MGFFKNVGATLPTYEISDVIDGWVQLPLNGETFLLNVLGKKVPARVEACGKLQRGTEGCDVCAINHAKKRLCPRRICNARCSWMARTDYLDVYIESEELINLIKNKEKEYGVL